MTSHPPSWTPPGKSRSKTLRYRRRRTPVALVAIATSAILLLAGVLAVIVAWQSGDQRSGQRAVSSANSVQRQPQANSSARRATGAKPNRVPQVRATDVTESAASTADDREGVSGTLTDDRDGPEGAAPPEDKPNAMKPGDRPESSALADALTSAQQSIAAVPAAPTFSPSAGRSSKDYEPPPSQVAADDKASPELSPAERRRLAEIARLKKLIQRRFIAQPSTTPRRRGQAEDYFVVAKYEMPLATRMADVRFEISQEIPPSVDQVADYLLTTPSGVARDFQVVGRFASLSEAEEGISAIRQRYDQAKEYQAQLLSFLQAQQRFQAQTIRRC